MAADTTRYAPDEMLTRMECMHLFCEKLKYKKDSYYKYHRQFIKFRPTAYEINENGQKEGKMPRIPYRIALGMINWLQGSYDPERDPAMEKMMNYMNHIPAHAGN